MLHVPRLVAQPFPVAKHPAIHVVHYAYVVYVAGASEHTLSEQVPDVPLAVQVQDLAPDVATFPKKNLNL